jgi:lysophospholipase L1-like esterase/cell division protein FtsB
MRKINEILAVVILSLLAVLVAAVGMRLFDTYVVNKKIESEVRQQEEVLSRNREAHDRVQEMRQEIEVLSGDREKLGQFIEEIRMDDEAAVPAVAMTGFDTSGMSGNQEQLEQSQDVADDRQPLSENRMDALENSAVSENGTCVSENNVVSDNEADVSDNTSSVSDNVINVSDNATNMSDNMTSVSENDTISGNAFNMSGNETISGNTYSISGNSTVSGNTYSISGNSTVSGNTYSISGNSTVSGNTYSISGNDTVSGNTFSVSGNNTVSGNAFSVSDNTTISVNGISVSGNDTVSDNTLSVSGSMLDLLPKIEMVYPEITLAERRQMRSSLEETLLVNWEDQACLEERGVDFSGKKIACLGDSITAAANLEGEEGYLSYAYPSVLKELLGAEEVYNLGIGGSSIGRYWSDAFVERYTQIPEDTDIIIVMGGTNDGFCLSEKEFGSLTERKTQTFCGDLDELMRGLKENYPEADIFFATPLPNILQDYLMRERTYLLPQKNLSDVILTLSAAYDFQVIDLYNSNILDSHDADIVADYMPDGVHANKAGYRILAEHIAAEMVRSYERLSVDE